MKKQLITCLAIAAGMAATETANAQQWTNDGTTNAIKNTNTGNVGIGTAAGQAWHKLTVNGNIGYSWRSDNFNYLIGSSSYGMVLHGNDGYSNGASIMLSSATNGGGMNLLSPYSSANGFNFMSSVDGVNDITLARVEKTGNIVAKGDYTFFNNSSAYNVVKGNSSKGIVVYANGGFSTGAGAVLNHNTEGGDIRFICNSTNTSIPTAFNFLTYDGANYDTKMLIDKEGHVIIGDVSVPTYPSNLKYKLIVEDGIITERLKVALKTDIHWSDFVFDDSYELMPLTDVESFVKENKHLPEVPSAGEVYNNGIDVAAMDAKLLQKIEELTLYVIQQQKEIDALKKRK